MLFIRKIAIFSDEAWTHQFEKEIGGIFMSEVKNKISDSVVGSVLVNRNFWLCVIINIINKMGRSCVNQPIKLLGNTLGMSAALIGLTGTLYYIISTLARTPFGTWLDSAKNKKLVLTVGFGVQALSFLFFIIVQNPAMYFAGKLLQGLGFGLSYIAMTMVVAGTTKNKSMGVAMGLLSMLPFILSSATNYITLVVRKLFGENYSFLGGAALILLCIILTQFLDLGDLEAIERKKQSKFGLVSMSALPISILMVLIIIPTMMLDTFIGIQGENAGLSFYAAFLSLYMLINGFSNGIVGYLRDRVGSRIIIPVALCAAAGTLILGFSQAELPWMVSATLLGIAGGGALTVCRAESALSTSKEEVGLAVATNAMVMDAVSIVINPVGGLIADNFGYMNMWKITALLPVIGTILAVVAYKSFFKNSVNQERQEQ